jgi:hypothetical protein
MFSGFQWRNESLALNATFENTTLGFISNLNQVSNATPAWVTYRNSLYIWFVVNLSTCIIGGLFNLLLIVVIFVEKLHKRGSGCLIVHLVLIEMLVCFVHLPLNTLMTFKAQFHTFPNSVCPYVHLTFLWTQHAGHWSAFFLAVNRLVASIFPHKYANNPRIIKIFSILMMIAAWVIGFVNNFLPYIGIGGWYELRPPWYSCGLRSDGSPFCAIVQALGVYVPEVGLLGLYFTILLKFNLLGFASNQVGTEVQHATTERIRRRYLLAKLMLVSSLWYCICYFPNTVIASTSLVRFFIQNPVMQLWMRTVFLLGYAVNPVSLQEN